LVCINRVLRKAHAIVFFAAVGEAVLPAVLEADAGNFSSRHFSHFRHLHEKIGLVQ
jgi:hypothetical protein